MSIADPEMSAAIAAARSAGEILKKHFRSEFRVIRKSEKEMVSSVDMDAQRVIESILNDRFPDYDLITEERRFPGEPGEKTWIIDPIDGTHNYIMGLPFSGISIGLLSGSEFQLGVILFPMENRLYHARKRQGAYLNGEPIHVSSNRELSKTIVTFDNQFYLHHKSFEYYKRLTEKAFSTRIFGTATNDLCWISEGRIDGRIWMNTKIFDIAAGIVILSEAGGSITNFDGTSCHAGSSRVVASNGHIHQELLDLMKEDV